MDEQHSEEYRRGYAAGKEDARRIVDTYGTLIARLRCEMAHAKMALAADLRQRLNRGRVADVEYVAVCAVTYLEGIAPVELRAALASAHPAHMAAA